MGADDPIDLFRKNIPPEIIGRMPASVARECRAIPVDWVDGLVVAMADTDDPNLLDKLVFILNVPIKPVWATRQAIEYAMQRYYPVE